MYVSINSLKVKNFTTGNNDTGFFYIPSSSDVRYFTDIVHSSRLASSYFRCLFDAIYWLGFIILKNNFKEMAEKGKISFLMWLCNILTGDEIFMYKY